METVVCILRWVGEMMSFDIVMFRWWKKDEPAPTAEDFHAATVREINEWKACVKDKGQAKCVRLYNPQQVSRSATSCSEF